MAEYKYTLPAVPPSNNKYIGRAAQWEYREVKKTMGNAGKGSLQALTGKAY